MSNKRKKLEEKAKELNLIFVDDTTDDELEQLISDFDTPTEDNSDMKYYCCKLLPGLSIQIGDEPGREDRPSEVRFVPYQDKDKNGDAIRVGYLATDEQDAQEILEDDPNVEEITSQDFEKATLNGKRAKR